MEYSFRNTQSGMDESTCGCGEVARYLLFSVNIYTGLKCLTDGVETDAGSMAPFGH